MQYKNLYRFPNVPERIFRIAPPRLPPSFFPNCIELIKAVEKSINTYIFNELLLICVYLLVGAIDYFFPTRKSAKTRFYPRKCNQPAAVTAKKATAQQCKRSEFGEAEKIATKITINVEYSLRIQIRDIDFRR